METGALKHIRKSLRHKFTANKLILKKTRFVNRNNPADCATKHGCPILQNNAIFLMRDKISKRKQN